MSVTHFWFLQSFEFAPANLLLHSQGGVFFVIDEPWAAPVREYSCFQLWAASRAGCDGEVAYVCNAERHCEYLDDLIFFKLPKIC